MREALVEASLCKRGHMWWCGSLRERGSAQVNGWAETVPGSRRREANSPDVSCLCGTWEPRCGLARASNPIARAGQLHSGRRKTQEAKAGRRKARGMHNPPDSAPWRTPQGG
jgi:hypothetical protein